MEAGVLLHAHQSPEMVRQKLNQVYLESTVKSCNLTVQMTRSVDMH